MGRGILSMRAKEKLYKKNVKLAVIQKIFEYRNILFGEMNEEITRDNKDQAWKEVFDYAVSIDFMTTDRDWRFLRNVFWQNMKRTAVNKLENYKNSGYLENYSEKLTNIDYLVLEILGIGEELQQYPKFKIEHINSNSNVVLINDDDDVVEVQPNDNEQQSYTNGYFKPEDSDQFSSPSSESSFELKKKKKKKLKRKMIKNAIPQIQSSHSTNMPILEVNNGITDINNATETQNGRTEMHYGTGTETSHSTIHLNPTLPKQEIIDNPTDLNFDPDVENSDITRLKTHYLQLKVRKMQLEILKLERELGLPASTVEG